MRSIEMSARTVEAAVEAACEAAGTTPENLLTSRAIDIAKLGASEEERKRWDAWEEALENAQTIVSSCVEQSSEPLEAAHGVAEALTSCVNVSVISTLLVATYVKAFIKGS